MRMARWRNTSSSLWWYFSTILAIDSASIRAWAGSYTPQGRSQWAWTTRVGRIHAAKRSAIMRIVPFRRDVSARRYYHPGLGRTRLPGDHPGMRGTRLLAFAAVVTGGPVAAR